MTSSRGAKALAIIICAVVRLPAVLIPSRLTLSAIVLSMLTCSPGRDRSAAHPSPATTAATPSVTSAAPSAVAPDKLDASAASAATPESLVLAHCRTILGLEKDQKEAEDADTRCFPLPSREGKAGEDHFLALKAYRSERKLCHPNDPSDTDKYDEVKYYYLVEVEGTKISVPTFADPSDEIASPFLDKPGDFAGLVLKKETDCDDDWDRDELAAAAGLGQDGARELFVTRRDGPDCGCEGYGHIDTTVLTLKEGALRVHLVLAKRGYPWRTYPVMDPEQAAVHEVIKDLDGDGRPDLVGLAGPYGGIEIPDISDAANPAIPGIFVRHARADGTFSADDEVAKRPVQQWCGERGHLGGAPGKPGSAGLLVPASQPTEKMPQELARAVVCARLRGATAAEVHAAATAACRAHWEHQDHEIGGSAEEALKADRIYDGDTRECQSWLKKLIDVTPPCGCRL